MSEITKQRVLEELQHIAAPDGRGNLVSAGLVSDIAINQGQVMFALNVDARHAQSMTQLQALVQERIQKLPGVTKALVVLTAERVAPPPPPAGRSPAHSKLAVPGIKHLIAVASGKGGVGKSTTAINLALAFKANGLKVAVLDADIYGPSMPRLFGLSGNKPEASEVSGKRMKPMSRYGVEVASIGFLVDEATPMIWRGPMVISALTQLLRDVEWSEADVMVIDMPPGTGDAQLSLAQQTSLSGAIIVSTPQDLALIDARKGLAMFQKVNVPVLGLIENMSYFICDGCGKRHEIFSHGGAKAEAAKLGLPFLGELPLDPEIRKRADAGEPIVVSDPTSPNALTYRAMAKAIWAALEAGTGIKTPPRIVVAN